MSIDALVTGDPADALTLYSHALLGYTEKTSRIMAHDLRKDLAVLAEKSTHLAQRLLQTEQCSIETNEELLRLQRSQAKIEELLEERKEQQEKLKEEICALRSLERDRSIANLKIQEANQILREKIEALKKARKESAVLVQQLTSQVKKSEEQSRELTVALQQLASVPVVQQLQEDIELLKGVEKANQRRAANHAELAAYNRVLAARLENQARP